MNLGKEFLEACAVDDNPAFSNAEINEILESLELKEEIKHLAIVSIRGQGYYRFTHLVGVENKFDMEQFLTDDETTDNHWNASWLAVTLQEFWNKPTIKKVLTETFREKKK